MIINSHIINFTNYQSTIEHKRQNFSFKSKNISPEAKEIIEGIIVDRCLKTLPYFKKFKEALEATPLADLKFIKSKIVDTHSDLACPKTLFEYITGQEAPY